MTIAQFLAGRGVAYSSFVAAVEFFQLPGDHAVAFRLTRGLMYLRAEVTQPHVLRALAEAIARVSAGIDSELASG